MTLSLKQRSSSADFQRKEFQALEKSKVDLRNIKVLSGNDWDRIQYRLKQSELEAEEKRHKQEERDRMKAMSQDFIKNWTNTVLGQRQKKLAEREKRLAREEEVRVQKDIEESKYQGVKRKEAIERAKMLQYYQTDRVKDFHSALVLTEVLKEREAQLELKRLKQEAALGADHKYVQKMQRDYEESLKADHEKLNQRITAAKNNSSFLRNQIEKKFKMTDDEREGEMREGDEIRRLAVAHALELQRMEQIHREEQREKQAENLRQIQDVKRMREIEKMREQEENDEIRVFVAAKKKMLKLRLEKEKEIYAEKQRQLEKIKERLSNQLRAKMDTEEERMNAAIVEREQKFAEDELRKERSRIKMLEEITAHRNMTFARMEQEKKDVRQHELEMIRARKEADELFQTNEVEKRRKLFDKAIALATYNLDQLEERQKKTRDERQQEIRDSENNIRMLNMEENVFQDYARRVIDHCEKGGRNTYALKKAARKGHGAGQGNLQEERGNMRPSYQMKDQDALELPNYQRDETDKVKQDITNGESEQDRMGFVW